MVIAAVPGVAEPVAVMVSVVVLLPAARGFCAKLAVRPAGSVPSTASWIGFSKFVRPNTSVTARRPPRSSPAVDADAARLMEGVSSPNRPQEEVSDRRKKPSFRATLRLMTPIRKWNGSANAIGVRRARVDPLEAYSSVYNVARATARHTGNNISRYFGSGQQS